MKSLNKYTLNYFLFLFSIIPLTILLGSSASLMNILMIDFSFLILIFLRRDLFFLKNKILLYLIALYIYLIFNSFISLDFSQSYLRNFGFIRFIIFFIAFNYFFLDKKFSKRVLQSWFTIILIVLIDIFIESFFGKNILGYGEEYGPRIVSFFKDEPIVGSFIFGFYFILVGYLLEKTKLNKFIVFLIIIFFMIAIFLTGERSNTFKALLGLSLFLFFIKSINFRTKIVVFSVTLFFITILLFNSNYLKTRFIKQIKHLTNKQAVYFDLYSSGLEVFKNNILFGVGNKNYRVETCKNYNENELKNRRYYICNTHPHQIYLELLSEHGLFGSLIILSILYKIIFSKVFQTFREKNNLKIGSLIYLIMVFVPLLPSGAIFSSFSISIFMINLSIFYALDKKNNIFAYKLNNYK